LTATPTAFSYSPFLHLWSIAIEIQFYIFAPLIYLAIKNKTVHRKVLTITAAASFLTYLTLLTINPTLAYYFTGSRIWLFALGALIFITPIPQRMATKTKQLTVTAATIIIAYMIAYPYITPQVTLLTLMPILATALIIFLHKNNTRINRSETKKLTKPVILLADISYPLYLIHYPVFFFTHHYYPNLMLPAVIFSILAAWLMHVLVEKPAVKFKSETLKRV
jgi:peptidoglycan/LPS O-acetylase OafA/YrhL